MEVWIIAIGSPLVIVLTAYLIKRLRKYQLKYKWTIVLPEDYPKMSNHIIGLARENHQLGFQHCVKDYLMQTLYKIHWTDTGEIQLIEKKREKFPRRKWNHEPWDPIGYITPFGITRSKPLSDELRNFLQKINNPWLWSIAKHQKDYYNIYGEEIGEVIGKRPVVYCIRSDNQGLVIYTRLSEEEKENGK